MRTISKTALRGFWEKHPDAERVLRNWYKITLKADWNDLADVKKDFSHADQVGGCIVFNIGGNKYRLITKIKFRHKIVYVRFVLTHAEYSRGKWKDDCSG